MTNAAATPRALGAKTSRTVGLILLAVLLLYLGIEVFTSGLLSPGTTAPTWRMDRADKEGQSLALDDLEGRVVVLDFFSPYCPPCQREFTVLERIAREWQGRGVEIVGVALEGTREEVRELLSAGNMSYPIVFGTQLVADAYKIHVFPSLYVIDPRGVITAQHKGFWDYDGLTRAVAAAHKQ